MGKAASGYVPCNRGQNLFKMGIQIARGRQQIHLVSEGRHFLLQLFHSTELMRDRFDAFNIYV